MYGPQKENGYTAIANEIMDALCKYRIPGEQMQILICILRMTYGWNRKQCDISLNEFSKLTGMNRQAVVRAIKNLRFKNLIFVIKNDTSKNAIIKNGTINKSTYGFNKNYENWQPVSKKIPPTQKSKILKECYLCGFKSALNLHHITPVSEGGSNRNENRMNLCPNCHALAHQGKFEKEFLLGVKNKKEESGIKNVYTPRIKLDSKSESIPFIVKTKYKDSPIPYQEIINYLNKTCDKNYRSNSKKTKDFIKARWNDGFRFDDFKKVIDIKSSKWLGDPKMVDYLRPETLFGTKFESYLNEIPKQTNIEDENKPRGKVINDEIRKQYQ